MVGNVPPDQNVRIPMNWGEDSSYTCDILSGTTATEYPFPSVEEQLDDETSLLNYYKKANNIRNKHLEIARGEVKTLLDDSENYVIVINKEYGDSNLGIAINFNQKNSYELNLNNYNYNECVNYLTSNNETLSYTNDSKNSISIPPYGIAILK